MFTELIKFYVEVHSALINADFYNISTEDKAVMMASIVNLAREGRTDAQFFVGMFDLQFFFHLFFWCIENQLILMIFKYRA